MNYKLSKARTRLRRFSLCFFQAAEKGSHVIEADEKGYCVLRPRPVKEADERPAICEEKSAKSLKQKKQSKTQGCVETARQNAKNCEKTEQKDTLANGVSAYLEGKHVLGTSGSGKQENGHENTSYVEKRKKKREKTGNEISRSINGSGEERCVIVNGNGQEAGRYVEHTRGARLPVREEAEPRHCGEECAPKETQRDTQGKKAKGRKKKKSGSLGKDFAFVLRS